MPTLAIIDGIRILIFLNDHDPPHFHVRVAGRKGKFDIATGHMISGRLDRRTILKVQQWTELNRELLETSWEACRDR